MVEHDKKHDCYQTLFDELITGQVRANDDLRILIYECAIRYVTNELNELIPLNGNKLSNEQLQSNEINKIKHSGLNVVYHHEDFFYDYETGPTELFPDKYLFIDISLNYPFLKSIDSTKIPEPLMNILSEPDTSDVVHSKLNINQLEGNRPWLNGEVLGWTNDGSEDFKTFLKLFPDVLEANSNQKRVKNSQKIVNMFYAYDQHIFFNKKINEIELLFIPDDLKQPTPTTNTISNWIETIQQSIDTYRDYYIPDYRI
jgi:hypothetical protein